MDEIDFDGCLKLFLEKERETGSVSHFIRIGEQFTICLKIAESPVDGKLFAAEKFLRPFAHLLTSQERSLSANVEVSNPPDMTLFVWDSQSAPPTVRPNQLRNVQERNSEIVPNRNVRTFRQSAPDTLSLFDSERRTGLFWIEDFNLLPWSDTAHPLAIVLAWWAATRGMQFLHAGCVGISDSGALVIGKGGVGKSTLCLSAIAEKLSFAADDFCLVGTESGVPFAYSLYSTAMLDPVEQIPQLAQYKIERANLHSTNAGAKGLEKAILSIQECRPDAMIEKVPITSIILLSPVVTSGESMEKSEKSMNSSEQRVKNSQQRLNRSELSLNSSEQSMLEPISSKQAISVLASSTSQVANMIGLSGLEFLALHRIFAGVPCYKLNRSANLATSAREIATLVNQAKSRPGRGVEQCSQA